jgi:hypothetical protein
MLKGGTADTIVKMVVGAALAAGVSWNTWLTTQLDQVKTVSAQQTAKQAVNDLQFQYIAKALGEIQTAILEDKPPIVKVFVPPVPVVIRSTDEDVKARNK